MTRSLSRGRDIFCQVAVRRVLCKSSGDVGCCTLRTSLTGAKASMMTRSVNVLLCKTPTVVYGSVKTQPSHYHNAVTSLIESKILQ